MRIYKRAQWQVLLVGVVMGLALLLGMGVVGVVGVASAAGSAGSMGNATDVRTIGAAPHRHALVGSTPMITQSPIPCSPLFFDPAVHYPVDPSPYSVAVGDFNRDGNQDLATASWGVYPNYLGTVSVLLGKGDGTFKPLGHYLVGRTPSAVAVGDFNNDDNPDLAAANKGSNSVSVLIGNGDGTFLPPLHYPVGANPTSVAVGAFNNDSNQDLAVTGTPNFVWILLGNGNGSFQPPVSYPAGATPASVAVVDVNRDGNQDLTTANRGSNSVSVLIGNGDGTFLPLVDYPVGSWPISIAAGRFNGDGNEDLVTANQLSNNVSVLLGNGDGTFRPSGNYLADYDPTSVAVGYFNEDGHQDLVTSHFRGFGANRHQGATSHLDGGDPVRILPGNGDGTFRSPIGFTVGLNPFSVAVGDFNNDVSQDIATANLSSDNVSILINTCRRVIPTTTTTTTPTSTARIATTTATGVRTATGTRPPFTPTATTTASATPCPMTFSDVAPTDYFYQPVRHLFCRGVISGYSDNTFRPYNNTTRGQLCKIVVLAFGYELYTPPTTTFTDVPGTDPFYQYIETAAHNNMVSGYSDGTFRPNNNVTRGQLSKIVVIAVQAHRVQRRSILHSADRPNSDGLWSGH